jgi:DNA repair exonuclease SbcCD ATPase subunit
MLHTLKVWKTTINNHYNDYRTAVQQRRLELQNQRRLKKEIRDLEEVQKIIQTASAEIQYRIHQQIAAVVTRCLKTVFGEDAYDFEIRFTKQRNKTEAQLVFHRNGQTIDPLDAAGGGVLDIASLALRIACLITSTPKLRKLVVLDEPLRHVAIELRPVAIRLLKELAEELKIQFLIVTHISEFENIGHGKVIKF